MAREKSWRLLLLMNTISYRELRKYQDYRIFRRTQKLRALGGFICIIVFWVMMYFTNNPEFKDSDRIVVYIILGLMSLASLYSMFIAFIKIPTRIEGIIQYCRATGRMVRGGDDMDSSYIMEYGISNNGKRIYGKNVGAYTGKNYKKLNINDEVVCFSFGKGNTYFVKK